MTTKNRSALVGPLAFGAALVLTCAGYTAEPAAASAAPTRALASVPGGVRAGALLGTRSRPAVEDCGFRTPKVRPASLTLACADDNTRGVSLVWKSWGPAQAYATGEYTWNTCVPYCAASKKWDKAPANFSLDDPVHTAVGWLFERLVVHVTGKVPKGVERVLTLSEKPVVMQHNA